MLTTKQVRAIIRKHVPNLGTWYNPVWTNKWNDTNQRSVKVYNSGDTAALLQELRDLAGAENVRIVPNDNYCDAITVRCVIQ
jgi:hypothetical protein